MPAFVHFKVKDVAIEMAHVLYDTMMEDNEWYDLWKKRFPGMPGKALEAKFVAMNWPRLVGQARATLAGMLASPHYSDSMKEDIFDALTRDATLTHGRPRLEPGTRVLQ